MSGTDPGQGSAYLGGLAPQAELRQDQGHRCCILCTLRVSVPPGDFLLGCGSAGSRIKPAALVGIAGLCPSVVPSYRGNLLLPLPPHLGAVSSWQPFPAPTQLQWCLYACWDRLLGMCLTPGVSFCSRADSRAFGLLSFRVGLQKCLEGRITVRFVQVVLSDPTCQPVPCAGGCCALALQGMNVPFPFQPSRSQRLLEEYLSFTPLCDN